MLELVSKESALDRLIDKLCTASMLAHTYAIFGELLSIDSSVVNVKE